MHAMSFVGTVRHVESELTALRNLRRLDEERPIRTHVWRAFHGLTDLVELGVVTFPVPSLSRPPSSTEDDAVRSVLRTAYERDGAVGRDEVDTRTIDAGRVEVVADRVLVPLPAGGPAAANWYVLYPWLGDRLDGLCESCSQLAGRIEREDWPEWADALRGLEAVAADLQSVVGHAVAVTEWIAPPDGGINDETRDTRRTAARLVRKLSNEL